MLPQRSESDFIEALTALRHRPLIGGNRLTLLRDGPQTHDAQLAAIAAARHHVHLETYLLTDGVVGQRYADALTERARLGVRVRLMLDGIGALGAGDDYRQRLLDAGVRLREFNPVNPLRDPRLWRVTRRTHRKTLIVDGRIAFTGGVNITDAYRSAAGERAAAAQRAYRHPGAECAAPGAAGDRAGAGRAGLHERRQPGDRAALGE